MGRKSMLTEEEKKDRRRQAKARYREKNRAILNEKNRLYRKNNPDIVRESNKKWASDNPDKVRAKSKRYADSHKPEVAKRWDDWYSKNKLRVRENKLKRVYGLSNEDYDKMLQEQSGCCKICGVKNSDTKKGYLVVDHCHKTGKVRSLLCDGCNRGLGFFRDLPEVLEKAAQYLKNHLQ
jgi:hypothetical protein